jgi:hypothetical protein
MMLAPALASVTLNLSPQLARTAVGPEVNALQAAIERVLGDREVSCFYSEPLMTSQAELLAVAQEALAPDWDGYGAVAVNPEAVTQAEWLLQQLPRPCRTPEFSIHPDGMVGVEWTWGKGQMISLALDGSGLVYYASSIGRDKRHGATYVSEALPQILRDILAPLC